ncbi:hypothetical protein D3C75_1151190 [compost metagenome]
MDAVDQNAAPSWGIGADLSAIQKFRLARHQNGSDHHLYPNQSADYGLDGLHLLQGNPKGNS